MVAWRWRLQEYVWTSCKKISIAWLSVDTHWFTWPWGFNGWTINNIVCHEMRCASNWKWNFSLLTKNQAYNSWRFTRRLFGNGINRALPWFNWSCYNYLMWAKCWRRKKFNCILWFDNDGLGNKSNKSRNHFEHDGRRM